MTGVTPPASVLYAGPVGAARTAARLADAADGLDVTGATGIEGVRDALSDTGRNCECVVSARTLADGDWEQVVETAEGVPVVLAPRDGDESLAAAAIERDVAGYVPDDGGEVAVADAAAAVASAVAARRERRTERAERETERRVGTERFQRLVSAVEDYAIFVLDAEGRVRSWNDGARSIKGYEREEILGEHVSTFYTEADVADGVPEANLAAAREDGRTEDEGWRVRADGSRFWADVVITTLRDDDGTLEGYAKVTRDATDRRAFERELVRERDDLAALLERVSDADFGPDDEGRFTYVNERAADLIDVDPVAARGEVLWDLFPAAVGTTFEEQYRRAMTEQVTVSFEEYFPPLETWFDVTAYPSETGLSVYFRDVTERRARRQRTRALVEHFPNGVVALFDEDLRFQRVGGTLLDELGADPSGLEGERAADALPRSLYEEVAPRFRAALDGEDASFVVERDREVRRVHVCPVEDETGAVFGGMMMSQDVTDQRRRERQLRDQRQRLATLNDLNTLSHGIAEAAVEQSDRAAVEDLVCESLAGSDSYEFAWVGESDGDAVTVRTASGVEGRPEDPVGRGPDGEAGPPARALATREMQVVQDVDERDDAGRQRADERDYRSTAAIPITFEDTLYGVLNVYSARRGGFGMEEAETLERLGTLVGHAVRSVERERELEQERERLEFLNRLIRHNLLNSLNVVGARLDILEGEVEGEAERHLGIALERTREMGDLVETIRTLMQSITDGSERDLEPVAVGEVLTDEVRLADESFEDAEFSVRAADPPPVLADDLLEEVFENLLTNAVQHNDAAVPRVTASVDATADGDAVTVRVADNGPGLPAGLGDELFGKGTKRFDSPGTGFGLHLCREIVESYGGEVSAGDRPEGGAVFEVTLPRADAAARESAAVGDETGDG